jgi:hypothetical protein
MTRFTRLTETILFRLSLQKKRLTSLSSWHHIGFVTFAAGFATIIPAAIILNVLPGGWTETIGSFLHRLAMYIILIGGMLVVAAYQAPRQAAAAAKNGNGVSWNAEVLRRLRVRL